MGFKNINVAVGGPDNNHSYTYKEVILKPNIPFATQVVEPNRKYVIKWDFDLRCAEVTIPADCVLEFDGGSLNNGTLLGSNTRIYTENTEIFNSIVIDGIWNNKESCLSWFAIKDNDDCVPYIQSASVLSNKVLLDKGGTIKSKLVISKDIEIDGRGNLFNIYLNDTDGSFDSVIFNEYHSISIHDINFEYVQTITTLDVIYRTIHSKFAIDEYDESEFYNISVKGFDNRNSNPASIECIYVSNFNDLAKLSIHDISISNNIVLGNIEIGDSSGGNYGIHIHTSGADTKASGVGEVYNIVIKNIANCNPDDHSDLTFSEDTTGIYLSSATTDFTTRFNLDIHDCNFINCSRRCFKIQASGVSIRNIQNYLDDSGDFVTKQDNIIDVQGYDGVLDNFKGDVTSYIARCKNGTFVLSNSVVNYNGGKNLFISLGGGKIISENNVITINGNVTEGFINSAKDNNIPVYFIVNNSKILYGTGIIPSCPIFRMASNTIRMQGHCEIANSIVYFDTFSYSTNNVCSLNVRDSQLFFRKLQFIDSLYANNSVFTGIADDQYLIGFSTAVATIDRRVDIINCKFNYYCDSFCYFLLTKDSIINIESLVLHNVKLVSDSSWQCRLNIPNGAKYTKINNIIYPYQFRVDASLGGGMLVMENINPTYTRTIAIPSGETAINPLNIMLINSSCDLEYFGEYVIYSTKVLTLNTTTILQTGNVNNQYLYSNKLVRFVGNRYVEFDGASASVKRSGVTSSRPIGSSIYVGFMFMDTTLGKPIYASAISGDTVTWVDATGTPVS